MCAVADRDVGTLERFFFVLADCIGFCSFEFCCVALFVFELLFSEVLLLPFCGCLDRNATMAWVGENEVGAHVGARGPCCLGDLCADITVTLVDAQDDNAYGVHRACRVAAADDLGIGQHGPRRVIRRIFNGEGVGAEGAGGGGSG